MFRMLKLKPPHGWNAVVWELAIVTAGVLLALGAQEFAQAIHSRSEVRETRDALDAEYRETWPPSITGSMRVRASPRE